MCVSWRVRQMVDVVRTKLGGTFRNARERPVRHKRPSGLPSYFINSISIGRRVPLGTVLHMKFHLDIKNCRGAARRWLLRERMPEEKTQHFPRCIRSPRIRIRACRAPS